MALKWGELEEIFRPKDVHMGVLKADPEKCTHCGLCIENCLFRSWEMGEDEIPRMKENAPCFSCYNCMVACPVNAISIVEPYHVDSGFWKTLPHTLEARLPLEPKDADGNPDKWTKTEEIIFKRRSVRNFKDKPVPEPLIKRVLEAGRFAPSGGNAQPWQFIVITNQSLIQEMNEAAAELLGAVYKKYMDEDGWKDLALMYQENPISGSWDPRIILGGIGKSVVERINPVLLGAPVVILIACDSRAIGTPQMQVGICGQNMILSAKSLGLMATWVGFISRINMVPSLMEKLGIKSPFSIMSSIVLGYPKFKQEGVVPREFRPRIWFREGVEGPEIEE